MRPPSPDRPVLGSVPLSGRWLLAPGPLVAVILVAMNLRGPFTSVGPVLPDIRADLGLASAAAALLTGLPVLCLGVVAPLAPVLSRRVGVERAVGLALGALGIGLVVRATGPAVVLLGGTIVVGGAIAITNVLLPVIVKRDYPSMAGWVTGIYTTAMGIAAAAAAALTIPAADGLGIGWRGGIAVWAVLVVVALAYWLPRMRGGPEPLWAAHPGTTRGMALDPLAWQVTLYLGLQSLGFYTVVAWLPSVYRDLGMGAAQAGLVSALVPLGSVIGGLTVPGRAGRAESQAVASFVVAAGTAVGLFGVMVAPMAAPYLWALIIGTCQGAGFPLALTLIVLRTRVPQQTQALSAMAQTVGYLVACLGPVLIGAIHDALGGWSVSLLALAALAVLQGVFGLGAGRPMYVGDRGAATR